MNSHREIKLAASYNWFILSVTSYITCVASTPCSKSSYFPVSAKSDQRSQNARQYESKVISKIQPKTTRAISELGSATTAHILLLCLFSRRLRFQKNSALAQFAPVELRADFPLFSQSRSGPVPSAADNPKHVTWLGGFLGLCLGTNCTQTLLFVLTLSKTK